MLFLCSVGRQILFRCMASRHKAAQVCARESLAGRRFQPKQCLVIKYLEIKLLDKLFIMFHNKILPKFEKFFKIMFTFLAKITL